MSCLNYSLATQLNHAYLENHLNREALSILSEITSIYCFDLASIAVILDFTHNTMTKVHFGHKPLCQTCLETLMVHTEIMLLLLFCEKFIVSPCTNDCIFTPRPVGPEGVLSSPSTSAAAARTLLATKPTWCNRLNS